MTEASHQRLPRGGRQSAPDPVAPRAARRGGVHNGRIQDGYSPEEAAARADAIVRRLVSRGAALVEQALPDPSTSDADTTRAARKRPLVRLAIVILVGLVAMLFSTWLATLGWPFNPVPHPLAVQFKS